MYHLLRSNGVHRPTVLASYPSFEAAREAAYNKLDILHFEMDPENPGCADMISGYRMIYMIEPADRRR